MVDYSELFDLVYFAEFFMTCVETNLSFQKGQFSTMFAFRFSTLDQGLARVASAETRRGMLAHSGGVPATRGAPTGAYGVPSRHELILPVARQDPERVFGWFKGLKMRFWLL